MGVARAGISYVAALRRLSRDADEIWPAVLLRSLLYRATGRRITAHARCVIRGLRNVEVGESLEIGLRYRGNTHRWDRTFLNVRGTLVFRRHYAIGRGCRFDIQKGGHASFGGGFVNGPTTVVVTNRLDVGDGTIIGWACQIMDTDFHRVVDAGSSRPTSAPISIGDHVWIGVGAILLKGVTIPSGCVVGAGSVVTSAFDEECCLIAGNPARVVKRGIHWE